MPLPLGHAAIGLAVHSCLRRTDPDSFSWRVLLLATILANLPDVDVLIGLLVVGNGSAFHRGPTHSLLFALVTALIVSGAWRLGLAIPRVGFLWSFLLVFSHVVADALFTNSSVSFWWPFEVYWSRGHTDWTDVVTSLTISAYKDARLFFVCGMIILLSELFRHRMRIAVARNKPRRRN